jgi:hypothetical protein
MGNNLSEAVAVVNEINSWPQIEPAAAPAELKADRAVARSKKL